MGNWLLKLIYACLVDLTKACIDLFTGLIDNVFEVMYLLNAQISLDTARNYIRSICIYLVMALVIKQGIDVYVLHTEGDSDADAFEIITRIAQTVAVIVCGQWIVNYLIKNAAIFTDELMEKIGQSHIDMSRAMDDYVKRLNQYTIQTALLHMILVTIMEIFLFILIFKAAKRAAELILYGLLIPIFSLDLLTTSRERWHTFFNELCICVFGYMVQAFSYAIFLLLFERAVADPSKIYYLFAAMAWMLLVLNAPKFLQKFSYSSGIGNAAKAGARSVVSLVPSIPGAVLK